MQVTTEADVLDEIQHAIQKAASDVGPAVVGLRRGSGVVIAKDQVLTVAHVLRGDEVTVTFHDGRTATAQVVGLDADADVALLAVDTGAITPIERAGATTELGQPVLALANPGGHGLRVTLGTVSSTGRSFRGPRGRRVGGSIEHTAPLPRGSSGGPLVTVDGTLLGLNAVRREGGLILALPIDQARVEGLASGRAGDPPRLGVALAHPRAARKLRAAVGLPEADGLLVRAVVDGSPAAAAGLQQGDLLISANDTPLTAVDDLFDVLDGGPLRLRVLRGAEEREVVVHFTS
jgi:serine protease Do